MCPAPPLGGRSDRDTTAKLLNHASYPRGKETHLTDKTNHSAPRHSITRTPRSADHALPTATAPDVETPDAPGETAATRPLDAEGVPHPRQGTPARRSRPGTRRVERRATGVLTGTVPTPEQWAQEQLKNAPTRSRAWARAVAAIYGLDVREE